MRRTLVFLVTLALLTLLPAPASAYTLAPTAVYDCHRFHATLTGSPPPDHCPDVVVDLSNQVEFINDWTDCHTIPGDPSVCLETWSAWVEVKAHGCGFPACPTTLFTICLDAGAVDKWNPTAATVPPGTNFFLITWYGVTACDPTTGSPVGSATYEKGYDPGCDDQLDTQMDGNPSC